MIEPTRSGDYGYENPHPPPRRVRLKGNAHGWWQLLDTWRLGNSLEGWGWDMTEALGRADLFPGKGCFHVSKGVKTH